VLGERLVPVVSGLGREVLAPAVSEGSTMATICRWARTGCDG